MTEPTANLTDTPQATIATAPVTFREFLEMQPPSTECAVGDWLLRSGSKHQINLPDPIQLSCRRCGLEQNFSPLTTQSYYAQGVQDFFAVYACRNCKASNKRYALTVTPKTDEMALIYKHGERPAFGIKVSPELLELLRPDAKLLEKALKCEAASLGIGAFVYYRRILEEMKTRIFDEVRSVAVQIDAGEEALTWIEKAKNERQFTRSIDDIKSAGLHAIYMDGHNPLTLLYDEISDGVHAGGDEENLEIAQRIRLVLGHLAARLNALKLERDEVKGALTAMLKAKKEREDRRASSSRGA